MHLEGPIRAAVQHLLAKATGCPMSPTELSAICGGRGEPPPGLFWLLTRTNLPGSTLIYDGPNAHDLYGVIGDGLVILPAVEIREEQACVQHWPAKHTVIPLFKSFHMHAGGRLFTGNSILCIELGGRNDDPPVIDVPCIDGPSNEFNLPVCDSLSEFLRACRAWNEEADSKGNRWIE